MTSRREFIAWAALAAGLAPQIARAQRPAADKEIIAFIGTGRVASTLGKFWAEHGHTIILGSRNPGDDKVKALAASIGHGTVALSQKDAAAKGRIVVVAVPGTAAKDAAASLGDLSGKLVIDVTNFIKRENNTIAPVDGPSIAEQIQALAPGAKVVKAFNTLTVAVMADPKLGGGHVAIPIAGDDKDAKARVAKLAEAAGLEPLDVGPLVAARYVEAMERLSLGYSFYSGRKLDFTIHTRD